MITCFLSRGSSCTFTTSFLTSAMVSVTLGKESFGCSILKPSMPRSSGNSRLTCSTVIAMPVFSEATATTFCTAQFWMGGRYSSTASMMNSRMGVITAIPIHLRDFFIKLSNDGANLQQFCEKSHQPPIILINMVCNCGFLWVWFPSQRRLPSLAGARYRPLCSWASWGRR